MIQIYVDADACPVKEEVFRVAKRHGLTVHVVANSRINLPRDPLFKLMVVSGRFDAADDWIVEQAGATDIAITSDIPLASRCLKKGSRVLDPKGRVFTDDSIGDALASRELSAFLRDMGEMGGGPKPYSPRDRSQFLNTLENQIQALLKTERLKPGSAQP
ncbi:YaiI/YqxD family protein [Holophaga foetida]|uniref:YaiI/YqxD family protein n=1 Tax=Holophaga foetida TaxID=35839 RepID=UPI0002472AB8|nr:YaiI/YqxD family protein [Holophaga foetida]